MITKTGVRTETATTVTWTFRNDYDSDSEYDCYDELGGSRPPRPAGGGGSRPPPPGRFRTPEPGGVAAHSREEGRLPRGVGCPQTSWAAAAGCRRCPPAGGCWPPPPAHESDAVSDTDSGYGLRCVGCGLRCGQRQKQIRDMNKYFQRLAQSGLDETAITALAATTAKAAMYIDGTYENE